MAQKVLLIINPVAGKTRGKTALFPLTEAFCKAGYEVSAFITAKRGDAEEVARERGASHDLVVCCGGDGTLGEVINGLQGIDHAVPLGYIPLGSTNDFASTLGLPKRLPRAITRVVEGEATPFDIGLWNDERYFSYIASFGAFTASSYSASQSVKNVLGHFAYVLEGAKELTSIRPYAVTVEADGTVLEGEYLFGAVSNSTTVGGMVKLNKELVDLHDGEFEVVLVKKPKGAGELSKLLLALKGGNFENKKLFDFFKASKISFTIEGNPPWSLDGDLAEAEGTIVIENCHDALLLRL